VKRIPLLWRQVDKISYGTGASPTADCLGQTIVEQCRLSIAVDDHVGGHKMMVEVTSLMDRVEGVSENQGEGGSFAGRAAGVLLYLVRQKLTIDVWDCEVHDAFDHA
jgi:hypothetical protein